MSDRFRIIATRGIEDPAHDIGPRVSAQGEGEEEVDAVFEAEQVAARQFLDGLDTVAQGMHVNMK